MKVVIITNVEHGWDNIVAVFQHDKYTSEELKKTFSKDRGYVIFNKDTTDYDLEEFKYQQEDE